jgi:hypothetical protein
MKSIGGVLVVRDHRRVARALQQTIYLIVELLYMVLFGDFPFKALHLLNCKLFLCNRLVLKRIFVFGFHRSIDQLNIVGLLLNSLWIKIILL